jgi:glutathione S-transferase
MITVHHLNNSRSQRVLWLLEELGLDYEIRRYQRDAKTMLAPPELRQVHPLGKSPVITDNGVTIAESGAIIEYLSDTYGGGRFAAQPGTAEYRKQRYWLHYAEGSVMPLMLLKLVAMRIGATPMPFFARPIAKKISSGLQDGFIDPQLRTHLSFVENELAATGWFVGNDLSIADVQMSFPLETAASRSDVNTRFPNVRAFLDRIHARPAYQRALEKGGEYAYAH